MLDGDEGTSAANPAGTNDKSTKKLSRRTLLKGAGAAAGADAIRGFPTDAPAQVCALQRINGVIAIEALLVGGGLLAGHPDQLLAPHHLAAGVDGWVRPRRRTRPVLIN
jgi:hypothetical protein